MSEDKSWCQICFNKEGDYVYCEKCMCEHDHRNHEEGYKEGKAEILKRLKDDLSNSKETWLTKANGKEIKEEFYRWIEEQEAKE